MSKKQGDVITYQRNGVAIQALVAFSRQVFVDGAAVEHLTVVYLDPSAASAAPTGEQLRNSIKIQADVPPLVENAVNGWKVVEEVVEKAAPEFAHGTMDDGSSLIVLVKDGQSHEDALAEGKAAFAASAAAEQKAQEAATEPIVTGEGKTQTQLDAELEAQKAERTPEEKALEPTN